MNHEDRALSDTLKSRMYDRKYVIFELFLALKRAELFLQSDQPQSVTSARFCGCLTRASPEIPPPKNERSVHGTNFSIDF